MRKKIGEGVGLTVHSLGQPVLVEDDLVLEISLAMFTKLLAGHHDLIMVSNILKGVSALRA